LKHSYIASVLVAGVSFCFAPAAFAQGTATDVVKSVTSIIGPLGTVISHESVRGHDVTHQRTVYDIVGGTVEIVGRTQAIEDAGMLEVRLSDNQRDKAISQTVIALLGEAERQRGSHNAIWTLNEVSPEFSGSALLVHTKEKNERIWRLERRAPQDNPEAIAMGNGPEAAGESAF